MKLFNKIFCLATFTVALSACNKDQLSESPLDEYFAISNITINETKNSIDNENIILKKNSKVELSCTVSPDNASDKSVLWTSSDETVATVSIDGVVEAKDKTGFAIISVTPSIGFGATDAVSAVRVQVVDNYVDIQGFKITAEGNKKEIFMTETLQLTATVTNQDATFKRFTWKSSNDEIATVDPKTGLVTGILNGDVTITATADDFSATPVSESYNLKIKEPIPLESLSFTNDPEIRALGYGQTYQIQYDTYPYDATRTLISWESSQPDVISVDNHGNVKVNTITDATVTITAKFTKEDGTEHKETIDVTVAKGRFEFSFGEGLSPWHLDSGQPGTVGKSDGNKTTINMGEKSGKYRADLQLNKEFYVDAANYPILAVKIALPDYGDNSNLTFELFDADKNGGNYLNGSDKYEILDGEANPGDVEYLYFDLTEKFGSSFNLPTDEPYKVAKITFKIADFLSPDTYDVYWIKTFATVEDLQKAVLAEENNSLGGVTNPGNGGIVSFPSDGNTTNGDATTSSSNYNY